MPHHRKGDFWDNPPSVFLASLKVEECAPPDFATRNQTLDCILHCRRAYNAHHPHLTVGILRPAWVEAGTQPTTVDA